MAKQEGYYSASICGCSDPAVILYFDGENLWAHGNAKPITAERLLFIDEKPFEHRNLGSLDGTLQGATEWFEQAKNQSAVEA